MPTSSPYPVTPSPSVSPPVSVPESLPDVPGRRSVLTRRGLLGATVVGAGLVVPSAAAPALAEPIVSAVLGAGRRRPHAELLPVPTQPTGPAGPLPGTRRRTLAGLYAWPYDLETNRQGVAQLNVSTIRTSPEQMTPERWAMMRTDGYQTHVTISGRDRADYRDERTWIADYLAQVDDCLSRYPFRFVEVWNEPNFGIWSGASPEAMQTAYGNLLVATFRHLRRNHPVTRVVGFGAGGSSDAAPGFIQGVLERVPAARHSYDVASVHPYIAPTAPDARRFEAWGSWTIEDQVAAVRRAGVSKPIWFTEVGWQISQQDGGYFPTVPGMVVSPYQQAAYTARTFLLAMRLGVQRVHHMYVIDTDGFNGGFFSDGARRPQADAFAFQQGLMGDAVGIDQIADGADGTHGYRVHTPRGVAVAAWSDRGRTLDVRCPRGSRVVDMFGNRVATARNQWVRLDLGTAPVYVLPPRIL